MKCRSCEYFDNGLAGLDGHSDCLSASSPRFQTYADSEECSSFVPSSTDQDGKTMPEDPQTGRIPVAAAKKVADEFGLRQCLLIGWDGEQVHVVTYGKTKADCEAAAKAQEFWTGKIREFSFRGR